MTVRLDLLFEDEAALAAFVSHAKQAELLPAGSWRQQSMADALFSGSTYVFKAAK